MIKFPEYFETYGGLNAVVKSRYFWIAVALVTICARYFITPGWWGLAIAVVPGLVGFSIAGVAIFVSLGSDSLRAVIAGNRAGGSGPSPFMSFMAMFTHFVVVQLLALLLAFVAQALHDARAITGNPFESLAMELRGPFWLLGGLLFCYAIMLCVALAVEIYRLAKMIDAYQTARNADEASEE